MVSEEHITAFGWATPQEIDDIMALAIRVNDFLSGLFLGVGIRLVDFKMETGRLWEGDLMRIVVADEISPEFVPALGHQVQGQARQGPLPPRLGGLVEAYSEVARRLGILPENEKPAMGGPRLVQWPSLSFRGREAGPQERPCSLPLARRARVGVRALR